MANPTSNIDRRSVRAAARSRRRGFTLVESLIASVMLSVSVVGVSGTILSSYQNDTFSRTQAEAIRSAAQTMDELTALPLDPATSSDVSLDDFVSYADQVASVTADSAVKKVKLKKGDTSTAAAVIATPTAPTAVVTKIKGKVDRAVSIARSDTLAGRAGATGDMAVVTVDVTMDDDREFKIKRLLTSAEAESNAN